MFKLALSVVIDLSIGFPISKVIDFYVLPTPGDI